MKKYLAIMKCRSLVSLQYKQAALANICTAFFWGIVQVMILEAFYAQTGVKEPISLIQAISFVWIGQALLPLLPWSLDKEVEGQIRSGNFAYEMLRPIDLYQLLFCKSFALRTAPLIFRIIPFVVLLATISPAASLHSFLSFIISLALGSILSASITTLLMIIVLWTQSGEGIEKLLPQGVLFLSGLRIPLPLFPDWAQPFLNIQPFRGILDIPCRLYTGLIPPNESLYYFGFQLMWSLMFIFLGKLLMRHAQKTLSIQGG